jgi:hypothetical protein
MAGFDQHSIVSDPLFVNPAAGDFRLRDGSQASKIGAGWQAVPADIDRWIASLRQSH